MASLFAPIGAGPAPSPFPAGAVETSEQDEDLLKRMNGQAYKGKKQDLQPHGEGEYRMRNGTVYRGSFAEGMFDGAGTLTFPDGSRFVAQWLGGALQSGTYFFPDSLEYAPRNWSYCTHADRRFWSEQQGGILFGQKPQLTDDARGEQNAHAIPYGTYDMGDCYLDPKDDKLYNYDGTYYRDPTPEELAWAKRKARIGLDRKPDAQ